MPSLLARQRVDWRTLSSKMELKSEATSLGSAVTVQATLWKTLKSKKMVDSMGQLTALKSSFSRLHFTLELNKIVMRFLRNHRIAAWAIIQTMLDIADLNKQQIE